MKLKDIETKLNNVILQLEDAEQRIIESQKEIQILKKQRIELEKFKKDYLAFEEKFARYGKQNRRTKASKSSDFSTQKKEVESDTKEKTFGVENMFNH